MRITLFQFVNTWALLVWLIAISVSAQCRSDEGDGDEGMTEVRVGDAWTDPRNPVAQLWDGKRLDLWSLRPPEPTPIPIVLDSQWASNPIDCFVLAKLQTLGLKPSDPADRKTLIRRATLDLTGLLPSPEEVVAFQEDESPVAYEALIDRLLSSPQYGLRWARHWLDVVRYADSNGFERDEFRSTMWRYRDYVVNSMNADLPYDQFVREQIAGDEMASSELSDRRRELLWTASGFLRLGPLDTTKSKFDTEEAARDEWMVDLTNTTGSAFLGQTLACCRCHDHKTDPLLQADHYRLRAFFAGIEEDNERVVDSKEVESEITRHNTAIDERLKPLQIAYEKALKPGRDRLTARTLSTFPAEIVNLLKQPSDARDKATHEKLAPYVQKLDFYDEDIAALLTADENPTYESARQKVESIEQQKREFTTVYCVKERQTEIPPTHILEGGVFTDRREQVQTGIFSLLDPGPIAIDARDVGGGTGRRSALARWIASTKNPWSARVMANRLWHHHFGRGIVATPDDFGYSGAPPTHPELLDWLAVEFVNSGWSIKHMHRLIMLSATYRQSSQVVPSSSRLDPNNRWLARQNLRRMDAETLRDCILQVAGILERSQGGSPRWPEVPESVLKAQPGIYENSGRLQGYYTDPERQTYVRSILLVRKRSVPLPFLSVFNLSDASGTCGRREVTINAPQALSLLNNPISIRAASCFAERLTLLRPSDLAEQWNEAFWLALGRPAEPQEQAQMKQLFQALCRQLSQSDNGPSHPSDAADIADPYPINASLERMSLAELCRALLNSNEFIFIE